MNWLRRRFGWFERRWIPEPSERTRHDERVRSRLADDEPPTHDPEQDGPPPETARD
ncbi:MAG: hypothetical protein ACR2K4_05110 [Candidatus Limnocylindria bacterium]